MKFIFREEELENGRDTVIRVRTLREDGCTEHNGWLLMDSEAWRHLAALLHFGQSYYLCAEATIDIGTTDSIPAYMEGTNGKEII